MDTPSMEDSKQNALGSGHESPVLKDETAVGEELIPEYLEGWALWTIMMVLFLTTLLSAIDIGIVATAIPGITDSFHKLNDVGWYGSACFLLVGASSPMWGKIYKYFPAKSVYISTVSLFLIGSIVAATAPNSEALIVGRAIQGWGVSGTLGGSVLMINYVAAPAKRPMLIGAWMGVFMGSTIIGPLIGGAFTSEVTWRWCFYINLPVGGPVLLLLFLFFKVPKHIKPYQASWKEIVLQLDLPGFALLLSSLVCYTLALQWGGQSKLWSDGSVIATLVLFGVLTVAFVIVEWLSGEYAMIPFSIMAPRMTWANAVYGFIINMANFQVLFYLPIYFQSVKGQSAVSSGVNVLPFMAFFALAATLSGGLVGKTRYLHPFQVTSGLLSVVGAALLYTLDVNSSKARYIGPQIIFGFGIGLGNQVPMMAAQGFAKPENIASTTSIMLMCNSISGAYFVTAAEAIFENRLLQSINPASGVTPLQLLGAGASDLRNAFKGEQLAAVLDAYMVGIKDVFAFAMAGSAFLVLWTLVIPFRRLPVMDQGEEKPSPAV